MSAASGLRLGFAGSTEFSRHILDHLIECGHELAVVYTRPDRPSGRGLRLHPGPVKVRAQEAGLRLAQPPDLRCERALEQLQSFALDLLLVVAWGLILPQRALDAPRLGCVNVHPSLLPRWRGAAPLVRAIEAGDSHTGISLMQMERGLDSGPILMQERMEIGAHESAGDLERRVMERSAGMLDAALPRIKTLPPRPQGEHGITFAARVRVAEAEIDWQLDAQVLERRVRAFNPRPGAFGHHSGQRIKVWRARVAAGRGAPGEVLASSAGALRVACGGGALDIHRLQLPGGRAMDAAELLAGRADRFAIGSRFG